MLSYILHYYFNIHISLMSNTLTLYYNPISMPSRACLTLLTLGNVPHTAKILDI